MADKLNFELVSPERRLAVGEADMVVIPGMEGDLGAQPGHAPFLTTLRPGILTVTGGDAAGEYFVTGGFAEVSAEGVVVLAEETLLRGDVDREFIDTRIAAARAELEEIDTDDHHGQRSASQRVNDLLAVLEQIL